MLICLAFLTGARFVLNPSCWCVQCRLCAIPAVGPPGPSGFARGGKQDVTKSFYQINQNYLVVLMTSFFFEYLQLLLKPLYRKIKVTDVLLYVLATNEFLFQSSNRAAQGHSLASQVSQGKTNACLF